MLCAHGYRESVMMICIQPVEDLHFNPYENEHIGKAQKLFANMTHTSLKKYIEYKYDWLKNYFWGIA